MPLANSGVQAQDWCRINCFVLRLLCWTCCGTLKMGVCLHVRAHAHCLPLTTPPPPHTIVDIDACCTQCGGCAVCCEERYAERGGRTDRRQPIASTHAEVQHSAPLAPPALATVTRTPAHTNKHQKTHAGRGKRHSAAPAGLRRRA